MKPHKDSARYNAANTINLSDKMFSDMYLNPGVIFFGEPEQLAQIEQRAIKLGLVIRGK